MVNLKYPMKRTEIWQYVEILKQPNKIWFFSKDNTSEKINALIKIAMGGYPSMVASLTEFLKDNNKEVREATCRTIICLFKKIDSKNGYYQAFRHCSISKSDIDFYERTFTKEQYVELLAISSLNGDGYVREKAVKKLTQVDHPKAIQFLAYRLADWVLPIRHAALEGIESYKSARYVDNLIENLPIFEWLQNVGRTHLSGIYLAIIEFVSSNNREHVLANFEKYPDKPRLLLAKHISNNLVDSSQELRALLTDRHFLIRILVVDHFDKLGQSEVSQLLSDASAKVRLQALYCLKDQNGFEDTIKKYLADNSATVRYFARFTLKQANINFADIYNQNLQEGHQIIGSLYGLSEVEAKQYSETIEWYLTDKKIKVRKTAFLALLKLDRESAYKYALSNLDTAFVGLRSLIIDFLSTAPTEEVLTKAREIYETGNYEFKKSMLTLFNEIGGWTVISDLMIGTIDQNERIRLMALEYLQVWRTKAVILFSSPQKQDRERAIRVFDFAQETHDNQQYFRTSPLNGLDFYFK